MKQKILIVNKFYYPRGGDCIVTMATERLLQKEGIETAVYAMQYPQNIDSAWSKYFAREVSFSGSISNKLAAAKRILGFGDIRSSFNRILDEFKPDIVHLNNIHSYLSPILASIAKHRNIRVVWTLHDYKLFCSASNCLSNGTPCSDCIDNPKMVFTKRCMKGSLVASFMGWLESLKWNRNTLEKNVDTFICPSNFMRTMMLKAGYSAEKLTVICNFLDPDKLQVLSTSPLTEREPYYCYIGRISPEKGIESLLEASAQLPYKLKIAGDGPLLQSLRSKYSEQSNIEFLGKLDASGVSKLLLHAHASIMPSVCYENNPLGVIESLCAGTPVCGANIGGIPELIKINESGNIFEPNNTESMRRAIDAMFSMNWDNALIRQKSLEQFSEAHHFQLLQKIYSQR